MSMYDEQPGCIRVQPSILTLVDARTEMRGIETRLKELWAIFRASDEGKEFYKLTCQQTDLRIHIMGLERDNAARLEGLTAYRDEQAGTLEQALAGVQP